MTIITIIANIYWVPTLGQLCILLGLQELSPLILTEPYRGGKTHSTHKETGSASYSGSRHFYTKAILEKPCLHAGSQAHPSFRNSESSC